MKPSAWNPGGRDDFHPWDFERMRRIKSRRAGTMDSVRLSCERGLPPINATGTQLAEYQRRMLGEPLADAA